MEYMIWRNTTLLCLNDVLLFHIVLIQSTAVKVIQVESSIITQKKQL